MKTKRWPYLWGAVFTVLSFIACQEWGEMDPPAGNQTYPRLERVANINFEEEDFDPTSFNYYAYENGEIAVVEDSEDELYGKVLHLPNGYARLFNPLNTVKVQDGVSITFMLKQAQLIDNESGEPLENDLQGALFSFQNANGTQRMFLTANGWLSYDALDGTYEANNPETECKTGMIDNDGLWHYVALKVRNDGYEVYVDGKKKVEKTETEFDFSKIVKFMASSPYLYIGYGADEPTKEMWIDDLRIYRNQITAKEVADYRKPTSGGATDFNTYITVGAEDNSSAWWTTFSDCFTFKNSLHLGFYNYGSGINNWNNWVLVVTNGKKVGEEGYLEYFVLRADSYGWNSTTNTNDTPTLLNLSNNFNFDTFIADMQGAYVDMTLTRSGNTINMQTNITTESGTIYNYSATYDDTDYNGGLSETIGAFLTCDGSHFKLNAEDVYTEGAAFAPGSYLVGPADCSAGFWGAHSKEYTLSGDTTHPFGYVFTNNNSGNGSNWNNWILAATNGIPMGGAGYSEYFVVRADAYGWSPTTNTNDTPTLLNLSHTYNFDTFVTDMQGAHVRIFLSRDDAVLNFTVKTRTAEGITLGDMTGHFDAVNTDNVNTFLTIDLSSLDIQKVGYFPYANFIEK